MSESAHKEEDDDEFKQHLFEKRSQCQAALIADQVARRTYILNSIPDQEDNVLLMDSAADQSVIGKG